MRLELNISKEHRKDVAVELANMLYVQVEYQGAPTFAYKVGKALVLKDGSITFPDEDSTVLEALKGLGYIEPTATEPEESQPEESDLNIQMPRDFFTDETLSNLHRLVESKADLIKKAFGTDNTDFTITDEKVEFPWFKTKTAEEAAAYTKFISAICDMAKNQKRITAKPRENENDKYAFRCFLLRLGFIGADFKEERKILLKNLSGSSAFPTKAAADEFSAKQKAKREEAKANEISE